jgi:myo-inositol-hexaphosphate 3-phosphohydrolase
MRAKVVSVAIAAALVVLASPAASLAPDHVNVPSTLETEPTGIPGDTADDPAIWVNTANPKASLVITNEKTAGRLTVFNLAGKVVQRIADPAGFYGNVDVRGRVVAGARSGIMVWRVVGTPDGPRLMPSREEMGNANTAGEGLCMYDPGKTGVGDGLYVINVHRTTNRVRVHPLTDKDHDGLLLVDQPVRDFYLDSEGEGCEVDDLTGALYLAEEDVGIWRYDLTAPEGPVPPHVAFASVGEQLSTDVEGLALAGGVLYVSAQNGAAPRWNWYARYDAATGAFLGSFRITAGTESDNCDQTDGIDAYDGDLGPSFPQGLFVCQDGFNDAPGTSETQNFKYAPLHLVDGVG